MKLLKSKVANKIRSILYNHFANSQTGKVIFTIKELHNLIPTGDGSCSCDRYIRAMRQNGEIMYADPRSNNNRYEITLLSRFFDIYKEEDKNE